jgi:hypothetical protein
MVRLAAATNATNGWNFVLAAALAVLGCVGCATASPGKAAAASPQFTNEEQKMLACLDLRDHIVDLYANEYVDREGLEMNRAQRTAFRDGWAEELAKRGTFDRFERSCFFGVTPRKYECGMASHTTGGLVACMKLSAR